MKGGGEMPPIAANEAEKLFSRASSISPAFSERWEGYFHSGGNRSGMVMMAVMAEAITVIKKGA